MCIFLAWSPFLGVQTEGLHTLGEIKQWRLHVQHGEVDVKLTTLDLAAPPNDRTGRTVLSLEPVGNSVPTVSEEAALFRQVMHEMPALGYDPSNLETVVTSLQNSEFLEGVESAVFKSGKWKSCIGTKYCYQAKGAAEQFLTSADAFKEFDTVLQTYGLRRKAVWIDEMGVGVAAGRVVCSGLLFIPIEKTTNGRAH